MEGKIDLNLLTKDEIIYELKIRNIVKPDNYITTDLRKVLRKAINQNVTPNVTNLIGKVSIKEEIEILSTKISQCSENSKEITSESRPIDVARLQVRLNHVRVRLNNVLKFKLSESEKTICEELIKNLKATSETLVNLEYDVNILNKTIDDLNTSNIQEEELCILDDELDLGNKLNVNIQPSSENNPVTNTLTSMSSSKVEPAFNPDLYQKLPNPMEGYYKLLPNNCDGLNVQDVLSFIKVLLKVKRETNLSDRMLIELFISKTVGPLQSKMLQSRSVTIDVLKTSILNLFIPSTLKQSLILRHVNRPQRLDEPLSVYMEDIKVYNEILDCGYCESQLVNVIKVGMRSADRINLSLSKQIETFEELAEACIQSQAVDYSNYLRMENENRFKNRHIPDYSSKVFNGSNFKTSHNTTNSVNQGNQVKRCFKCNKVGHLAKDCYSRKYTKN